MAAAGDPFAALPLDEEARAFMATRAMRVRLKAGDGAFGRGDPVEAHLWVISGSVRVRLITENGREITLYRVSGGESCVLTTSHLFRDEAYAADGVCETDVEAIALPAAAFRTLLGRSEAFRDMILSDYARRVGDILLTVDASLSTPLPSRLARLLVARSGGAPTISATHQDLAAELGTAREVVSRVLKDWERQGLVSLQRGAITLADRRALDRIGAPV